MRSSLLRSCGGWAPIEYERVSELNRFRHHQRPRVRKLTVSRSLAPGPTRNSTGSPAVPEPGIPSSRPLCRRDIQRPRKLTPPREQRLRRTRKPWSAGGTGCDEDHQFRRGFAIGVRRALLCCSLRTRGAAGYTAVVDARGQRAVNTCEHTARRVQPTSSAGVLCESALDGTRLFEHLLELSAGRLRPRAELALQLPISLAEFENVTGDLLRVVR